MGDRGKKDDVRRREITRNGGQDGAATAQM